MTLELNRPTIDIEAQTTLGERIPLEGRPTWLGFAINCLVATSSMTAEFLTGDMGTSYPRAVIFLTGILAGGAVWLALLRAYLVRTHHLTAPGLIALLIVSGLVLAIALNSDTYRQAVGIPPSSWSLWVSLVVYCVILPWWVVSLELLLSTRRRIRSYREQLLAEAQTRTTISSEQAHLIDEVRSQVRSEVHALLSPAARQLDDQLRREHDLSLSSARESIATVLHDAAREQVRPLSHSLHELAQQSAITDKPRHFISTLLHTSRFYPLPVSMLFLLTGTQTYFDTSTPLVAILMLLIGVTGIFALMTAANWLMQRFTRHRVGIFLGTLVVMQLPLGLRPFINPDWSNTAMSLGRLLLDALFGTLFIILMSGLGSWRGNALTRLEEEQRRLERERQEQIHRRHVTADVVQEAARALHGSVQTKLTAAALALTLGGDHADDATILRSLDQARQALLNPLPSETPSTRDEHTLGPGLYDVTRPWMGLCEIDIDTTRCPDDHPAAHSCALIVEEAVTNAVRHGKARHISIQVTDSADGLLITVADDGHVAAPTSPGLGSQIIDQLTTTWSREDRGEHGTTLRAIITTPDSLKTDPSGH